MKKRAIILQSGGATAVINQSLAGVIEASRKEFSKLYGSKFGALGLLKPDWIDLTSMKRDAIENLKQSPSSALGTCRHKLNAREAKSIIRTLAGKSIDVLFMVGGNDSSETGLLLERTAREMKQGLQVIAIPKTIDNDLPGMDHAPGYGSVARFIAVATQEASVDTRAARSTDPIKIIEVMGRNSGWIVAASALAMRKTEQGPHLLYFPERAFNQAKFLQDVKKVYKKFGYALIVISETIRDQNGKRIGSANKAVKKDKFGHVYIEGAAQYLCGLLASKLRIRARFDKPGTIQRMSMPYISKVDQEEAFQCGKHAVRLAKLGYSGVMVAMQRVSSKPYRISYSQIPLERVAGNEKLLPGHFINSEGNFVTKAFRDYALPLVGNHLPHYSFLA